MIILPLLLATAPAVTPAVAVAKADRVSEADLAAHIRILASDEYEGRKPGTVASGKTLSYIATAFARAGLVAGAADGGWFQPVPLVDRAPGRADLVLAGTRRVAFPVSDILALGPTAIVSLDRVELVEVGPDPKAIPPVAGRIAVVRIAAGAPFTGRRQGEELHRAGALGVLFLLPGEGVLDQVRAPLSSVTSAPSGLGGLRLYAEARRFDSWRAEAGSSARLSGRIATSVRPYDSHNVVARLPGSGAGEEAVAIIGHWDHLGLCRPDGAADRICNGAVDNASGIAVMIEVAERLAAGPRSPRDIVFVATTAEESGLLGAAHYVAKPTVPLDRIVGVLNIDTIAIGPRGLPVSAVNRGNTAIDPLIDQAARKQGRALDTDLDANDFIMRQDGAKFTEAGVPAVMAGGSFADMALLEAFLRGPYHGPTDEFTDAVPLGGAAEDAELHVLLARALADPSRYRRPGAPRP